ncbi:MAG: short-chain fatty acyl-CoA regulator family protein [Azospirillaceae bacterium]
MAKKAMLGHKVRRLRRDHSQTQAAMAERLGISPSYLNLIENNQRPVTVELLLKLGQVYDLDLTSFAEDDGARVLSGLQEAFGDPLFDGAGLKRQDVVDLAQASPSAAEAVIQLYQAYVHARDDLRLMTEQAGGAEAAGEAGGAPPDPGGALDEARDWFHHHNNYFADLEEAADEVRRTAEIEAGAVQAGLVRYLDQELTVRVKVMPVDVMGGAWRRYDRHGRRVLLSEMLPEPSRTFQLAHQIGLIRYRQLLDTLSGEAEFTHPETARLVRLGLANYLAGAVVLPYEPFWRAAQAVRYDIDILQHRFDASFEQVCHRLTTLQRPGAKGVPFFLIRVDKAGNIAKRFTGTRAAFARLGGACPRWNVHDAFRSPGRIMGQVSELPDGERWFSIAKTVRKAGAGFHHPGQIYAVALGCEIGYAAQLVYADGLDLTGDSSVVPIGLHCRLCERLDCAHRAFPPLNHRMSVDETRRGVTALAFEPM